MTDSEITPRLLVPSVREVEVEAGRTYRFIVRGYRARPEVTDGHTEVEGQRPLPRQLVPVVTLEGSFTATVHEVDISDRSIFVILEGIGSLQVWADAIVGVEEIEADEPEPDTDAEAPDEQDGGDGPA